MQWPPCDRLAQMLLDGPIIRKTRDRIMNYVVKQARGTLSSIELWRGIVTHDMSRFHVYWESTSGEFCYL